MIKLCKNWYLDSDSTEFKLIEWGGETRTDKDGRAYRMGEAIYHYSSLPSLMQALFRHLVREGVRTVRSLDELKQVIDNRYALVSELCCLMIPELPEAQRMPSQGSAGGVEAL